MQNLEALVRWEADVAETALCRKGTSPHAPYSIEGPMFRILAEPHLCLATHVAESPGEVELIGSKSGPFAAFLKDLGMWHPNVLVPSFASALRRTRTARRTLLVHGNYLSPDLTIHPNQSLVYCPRTHAAFGHPPHPFREFLARGVRVCLGTDSLASNPDLDLLAEARFVHARHPDFPGEDLLKMATLAGAEALGWEDEAGSLEAGKSADFVAVPLPDRDAADPHDLLFAADAPAGARRTLFRGAWRG